MEIKKDQIYTFKLNSGEELVAKVVDIDSDHCGSYYMIDHPVSIAPAENGVQMIPSAFTLNLGKTGRLNTNSITMVFETNPEVESNYRTATSGIITPEKKILKG
jgi:hypothetical protein